MQGVPDAAGTDPNWDLLNYPYSSCVSYKKDLSPLQYGDKVGTLPQLSAVQDLSDIWITMHHQRIWTW